jgi:hypothetical protein
MAPAQLSRQRRDNLAVGERLGELDHASEALRRESAAVLGGRLSRHRRNDLVAVGSPLVTEDFGKDPLPDLPVELGLGGVHRLGDAGARGLDQPSEFCEEPIRRRRLRIGPGGRLLGGIAFLGHEEDIAGPALSSERFRAGGFPYHAECRQTSLRAAEKSSIGRLRWRWAKRLDIMGVPVQ